MHFWGIFSMLLLCAVFFSCFIAEIVTDWVRKEYRRVESEREKDHKATRKSCGLSIDSILYRSGQVPDDEEN